MKQLKLRLPDDHRCLFIHKLKKWKYLKIFFRLSFTTVLWNTLKEGRKAFSVYADLIKDTIFLMIIVKALGDIGVLIESGWTFASMVSTYCLAIHIYSVSRKKDLLTEKWSMLALDKKNMKSHDSRLSWLIFWCYGFQCYCQVYGWPYQIQASHMVMMRFSQISLV